MSIPKLVPSDADVTVTVTADLTHRCPYIDEVDAGTVIITWRVNGHTIELHSLRDYLNGYATGAVSHEGITDWIRHDLSDLQGITDVTVTSTWTTAGMEVTCVTSPTPSPAERCRTP